MATKVSVNASLSRRLRDYKTWREDLIAKIEGYHSWLEQEGLADGADELRVYELVEDLKSDKLTIAIVGEFSRGKTELINAIFFADHKQRLLPTAAGRTTMCPTELRFDEAAPPCIKLLPIETRKGSETIAELKQSSTYWTTLPLELSSPKKMAETFHEIVKSKAVAISEAQELGLYHPSSPDGGARVQVPIWRHAVINYPHPLLKQGLVILDTPGLNALGAEPELTMSMLPNAHVVMFVLAADTGVTKSDLAIWNDHVRVAKGDQNEGRIVVLNKIDTLWDELRGPNAVAASISRQAQETAVALGIMKNQVFTVSAQKGLVGKIKQDTPLTEKSGLAPLEIKLSEDIMPAKQSLIHEKIVQEIGGIVETTAATLDARLSATNAELKELRGMSGKNENVIQSMMAKKRQDQDAYDRKMASLDNTRRVLSEQIQMLLQYLSMEAFDELITKTRKDMQGSWTTHGLKNGMKTFFDGAMSTMNKVYKHTERIKGLVEAIYKQFEVGHGLAKLKLKSFELRPYHKEFKRLYKEGEAFRNSTAMVMTEQHFVVKRFFITLVSRARQVFEENNKGAEAWGKAIMGPVFAQIREHKLMMDQRIENLKKIHKNLNNLNERIAELEATKEKLENQQHIALSVLPNVRQRPLTPGTHDVEETLLITQPMTPGDEATTITQPALVQDEEEAQTERLPAARGVA